MAEYIEREAAIAAIRNLYPGIPLVKVNREKWHEQNRNFMACETAIEHIPAADVRPVVHGKWIRNGWSIRCSECGYDMPFSVRHYCPNCGAVMREEQDGR